MVNRKIFFDIFFYNKENPSRELMEMAENLWRNYMNKYGLGLDAGVVAEPTYDEVREITIMANYATEMVAKQIAEAEAEEARRKQAARDAWERSWEQTVVEAVEKPAKHNAEETEEAPVEEPAEETPEENPVEAPEAAAEPAETQPAEETAEDASAEPEEEAEEAVTEVPVQQIPMAEPTAPVVQVPEKPVIPSGPSCDVNLWVEQLVRWCQSKGMQCIQSVDNGDVYLHVYLPHKKNVHTVGNWCFPKDTRLSDLAAEITKLYAYCEGFADCFARLIR